MEKSFHLVESPVLFNPEQHSYHLNGQELSGVTPIVGWLFPETYKGIPQSVLSMAADYGSMVHSKCELADSMDIVDSDIVKQYRALIEAEGLEVMCSEYLVSDEHRVASAIDKVFADDSLGDIKTTSKVHMLNVTVQLSIYAYLYERQTGRKVNNLYLIWLPKPHYGEPMLRALKRIPSEWCEAAINRYVMGQSNEESIAELSAMGFVEKTPKKIEGAIPENVMPLVDELMVIKKQLDVLSDREKELRSLLLAAMNDAGEDKWSNDLIQFSRRAESERVSIDTKALQANEPSIYESYKKVTKVAASLIYKVL